MKTCFYKSDAERREVGPTAATLVGWTHVKGGMKSRLCNKLAMWDNTRAAA